MVAMTFCEAASMTVMSIAAAVEGPDGFGRGLEHNRVGIGAGWDGGDGGKTGTVEDHDGVAAAIGNVAEFSIRVERHAMRSV